MRAPVSSGPTLTVARRTTFPLPSRTMNDTDCTPANAADVPNFTSTTFSNLLVVALGVTADVATFAGARPALMMI